jgi:hypothetical protein
MELNYPPYFYPHTAFGATWAIWQSTMGLFIPREFDTSTHLTDLGHFYFHPNDPLSLLVAYNQSCAVIDQRIRDTKECSCIKEP